MAILSAGLNLPQGGTMQYEFYSGGTSYWVNVFYTSGTLYVPVQKTGCVIFMIGGGATGAMGYGDQDTGKGGGGAGGALLHTNYTLSTGNHQIRVGEGGRAIKRGWNRTSNQQEFSQGGSNTHAFGVTAHGGGSGGGSDNNKRPHSGGCGGGGGARNSNSGWNDGAGSTQPSYSGWNNYGFGGGNSGGNGNFSGGGGGGIGGSGGNQNGSQNSTGSTGVTGGNGRDMSGYFGSRVGDRGWFGGGGGGGTYRHGTNAVYQAPPNGGSSNFGGGGYGVGSRESSQNANAFAVEQIDAMNGTGGGGGGSSEHHKDTETAYRIVPSAAGHGGDGCVIVRCTI